MAFGFQAEAAPALRRPLSLRGPNGHRPRLLLAEDSDPVRIVTAAMLKGMGCDVDAVIHGEDAVKSASANRFDVIVLDIEMPIMDGITAARSIRKLGGAAGTTPIMALSAFLADAMQQASWSDTFDIALPKPANKNELHAAVATALNWKARKAGRLALENTPLLSAEQIMVLKGGVTQPVLRELVAIACRDIGDCINHIARLGSAESVTAQDFYVHKLKALGRTFAAPRLALVAKYTETAETPAEVRQHLSLLASTAQATIEALRGL